MAKVLSPARLFALAAAGFLAVTLFQAFKEGKPPFSLHVQGGSGSYGGAGHASLFAIAAAICGLFALVYFACERFIRAALNRALSLASFIFTVLPIAAIALTGQLLSPRFGLGPDSRAFKIVQLALDGCAACFLIGCSLFVLNLIWTLAQGYCRPPNHHPNY